MRCSPTHLNQDFNLWSHSQYDEYLISTYKNLSKHDNYDCGLTSVPCNSNITKTIFAVDENLLFWTDVIFVYGLSAMLAILGIFGNIMNVIIFAKANIANDGLNTVLLCLSVSDLFMLLIQCLPYIVSSVFCPIDVSVAINLYSMVMTYMDESLFIFFFSMDFVTLVGLQRAAAVVLPFHVSRMFSKKNITIMIVLIIALNIVTNLPFFVCFQPRWVFHPYFEKQVALGIQASCLDKQFLFEYFVQLYFIHTLLILALLLISGIVTLLSLRSHAKKRATLKTSMQTTQMTSNEAKVTKLVLAVCLFSFVISCFYIIIPVILYVGNLHRNLLTTLTFLHKLLKMFESSYNCLIYIFMSARYKEVFLNIIRCRSIDKR